MKPKNEWGPADYLASGISGGLVLFLLFVGYLFVAWLFQ